MKTLNFRPLKKSNLFLLIISFLFISNIGYSQENKNEITLKGIVYDEDGPLPSASVIIKNTTTDTETDFDGQFTIKVSVGDTIIFSYVGYDYQEYLITEKNKNNYFKIEMKADNIIICLDDLSSNQIYQSKPSIFQRIKNIFKKKEN
ncbi:carboxypeptidase-like regulatory domain-containing protein [Aureivirga sp. CE67]|uniref:carboxypeptidase-like regulatory domain-containing protein n=1 Tax=Aureivirga sp. CE67 TaxID=1788983 RepID=UPI0018CBCA52|nr:carboxypeptidase-like regulatory domain-containing protein [Aureivirga sp. CE67]